MMTIPVGTDVPTITRAPDSTDLFMFSASAWLLHKIHYDTPFTTEHDGHPGLLVHGPLQGTYMMQAVTEWLGRDARIRSITYRHRSPVYLGDVVTIGGSVTATGTEDGTIEVDLWVAKADGTVTTEGTAVVAVGS